MEENNLDCAVAPQTDFEKVIQIIDEARKLHFDNKTPSDEDVEKFYKYSYDKLFGYRDSHQTVLSAPQRHNLVEVFKELKFGRPAEDQQFLDAVINQLQCFNASFKKATFGMAIEALKQGKKVARKGWNGKGMFLYLVRGTMVDKENLRNEASMQPIEDHTGTVTFLAHIDMFTAQKTVNVGWLASQTDMLSEDWEIVE